MTYRLAVQRDEIVFDATRYGYASVSAATVAAPTINRVRAAYRKPPYTEIAECEGFQIVRLIPLPRAVA